MDATVSRPGMDVIGSVDLCQLARDVQYMAVVISCVVVAVIAFRVWFERC